MRASTTGRAAGTTPPVDRLGLVTDLYELRMAVSYLSRGMTAPATFSLFVRRLPPDRHFLVAAGLDDALRAIERISFNDDDLAWLGANGFEPGQLELLADVDLAVDVWAVPEGTIVFPGEPLLEVTAPLPAAQLVETVVLNQITYQSAIASKAARCRLAVEGRAQLVDFAARRTHGIEASLAVARAAAIVGFDGTSNVEAARRFGLTPVGTMAHSYVEAFEDERDAFAAFVEDFPDHATLLVDTYDTPTGVERAISIVDRAIESNDRTVNFGVRLDSGDLERLAKDARRRLDDAGHPGAVIVASSSLDEREIARLMRRGVPIDVFGVGTRMGVSADAPSLDTAYKLVAYDGRPVMKLSPGKETRPGPKQIHRAPNFARDRLATRNEPTTLGSLALLEPVMIGGERVTPMTADASEQVAAARARFDSQLDALPEPLRSLGLTRPYRVEVSPALAGLTARVRRTIAGRTIQDRGGAVAYEDERQSSVEPGPGATR